MKKFYPEEYFKRSGYDFQPYKTENEVKSIISKIDS